MIIEDIYGVTEITEPVLIDLLHSKPVQRLKGIYQAGAGFFVQPKWNTTRYEHSVGALILVRKLGASLEEQIAALLHDVSHTAFSHTVDYALGRANEDYHEEIFDEIVRRSEIPSILRSHGYSTNLLNDIEKWTLLEKNAPDLCGDRIDYTLRDQYNYGFIAAEEIHSFLHTLIVIDGTICISSLEQAEWFVNIYYQEVIDFFLDPLNVYAYQLLAKALNYSFKQNIITKNELLLEDEQVMNRLRSSQNIKLKEMLNRLSPGVQVEEKKEDYEFYQKNKLRLIDPLVFIDNKTVRASSLSPQVHTMNKLARERTERGTYVKLKRVHKDSLY